MRITACAVAALLSACASLQTPVAVGAKPADVAVPALWQSGAADARASSLAQWWARFDDPMLTRLVQEALDQGTGMQAAQARLRRARALRDQAAAALSPTLGGAASAQGSARDGQSNTHNVGANLSANWEVDLWGANRSGVTAAEADLAAQRATLGGTAVSLAAEVAAAYIDLRNVQARAVIARNNLETQLQTLQITQWREEDLDDVQDVYSNADIDPVLMEALAAE